MKTNVIHIVKRIVSWGTTIYITNIFLLARNVDVTRPLKSTYEKSFLSSCRNFERISMEFDFFDG